MLQASKEGTMEKLTAVVLLGDVIVKIGLTAFLEATVTTLRMILYTLHTIDHSPQSLDPTLYTTHYTL